MYKCILIIIFCLNIRSTKSTQIIVVIIRWIICQLEINSNLNEKIKGDINMALQPKPEIWEPQPNRQTGRCIDYMDTTTSMT